MSTSDLEMRCRLLDDEVKVSLCARVFQTGRETGRAPAPPHRPALLQLMRSEVARLQHENISMNEAIKVRFRAHRSPLGASPRLLAHPAFPP